MMRTLAATVLLACASAFGAAAQATATPVHDSQTGTTASETPDRPGGHTHFSRGGFKLDNSGHPVTDQGPNKGTQTLQDTLEDAGVPSQGR